MLMFGVDMPVYVDVEVEVKVNGLRVGWGQDVRRRRIRIQDV